ncbi:MULTISPECIES: YdcH family protein [unclassified Rhizobium]|uniref:YdcH family protein n=1 Tax=unclassified Rhizobium TaxID=2613769 RepID=UPI0016002965|nr:MULTISPECIES: YdcH family protein [unclassified Rhizobium]MBB1248651.1 YdcH family protein [Rhizobium sp. G21]MCV3766372.1 YdcH family protein [Rhizobium sp. TRM95796]
MNPLMKALRVRHEILQSKIEGEMKAKQPDTLRITALKRMKLKLRDQIAALERAGAAFQQDRLNRRHVRTIPIKA